MASSNYVLTEDQKKLVEDYYYLVQYTIYTYFGSNYARDEDILQIGALGLCDAAAHYDESRGIQFSTYATRCIGNRVSQFHLHKNRKKRYSEDQKDVSFNRLFESGYDIEDSRSNTEAEALNSVLVQQVLPLSDRCIKKFVHGYTYSEIAEQEGVRKNAVFCSVSAELARARKTLTEAKASA